MNPLSIVLVALLALTRLVVINAEYTGDAAVLQLTTMSDLVTEFNANYNLTLTFFYSQQSGFSFYFPDGDIPDEQTQIHIMELWEDSLDSVDPLFTRTMTYGRTLTTALFGTLTDVVYRHDGGLVEPSRVITIIPQSISIGADYNPYNRLNHFIYTGTATRLSSTSTYTSRNVQATHAGSSEWHCPQYVGCRMVTTYASSPNTC